MSKEKVEKEFLAAYEEHADALFRHCYYRVYSRDLAKELVQETYMKAWDYVREGNEVDNMRAFLYRVATNLVIDRSRKTKDITELSLEQLQEDQGFDPGEDTREQKADQFEGKMLMAFLQELDETYREAVYMRYIDDLHPREIAEITGESENVISVRIHRGLKKLRALVEEKRNENE